MNWGKLLWIGEKLASSFPRKPASSTNEKVKRIDILQERLYPWLYYSIWKLIEVLEPVHISPVGKAKNGRHPCPHLPHLRSPLPCARIWPPSAGIQCVAALKVRVSPSRVRDQCVPDKLRCCRPSPLRCCRPEPVGLVPSLIWSLIDLSLASSNLVFRICYSGCLLLEAFLLAPGWTKWPAGPHHSCFCLPLWEHSPHWSVIVCLFHWRLHSSVSPWRVGLCLNCHGIPSMWHIGSGNVYVVLMNTKKEKVSRTHKNLKSFLLW